MLADHSVAFLVRLSSVRVPSWPLPSFVLARGAAALPVPRGRTLVNSTGVVHYYARAASRIFGHGAGPQSRAHACRVRV